MTAAALLVAATLSGCAERRPPGQLLVTSGFTDRVFVLDPRDGRVLDSLVLDRRPGERDEPHAVEASADGRHWYATLSHGEPSLWKYEVAGHRLVGRVTLTTHGASRVRLSPDGSVAAVPDYWRGGAGASSRVAFVRTYDLEVLATPEVCAAPHDAVFSPDGSVLAVTCALGGEVVLLDPETYAVRARVPTGEGSLPMNAVWSPAGERLWVTLMGSDAVLELEADGAFRTRASTGAGPAQIALSPGGARLAVANRHAGTVTIDRLGSDDRIVVALPGAHAHGVAFGPDPGVVYATYEGDTRSLGGAVAIDTRTGEVLWHTEVGVFTLGIAWVGGE